MVFDLKTTGMPYYDRLLLAEGDLKVVREGLYACRWCLKMLCPDDYIARVAGCRGVPESGLKARRSKKITRYVNAMAQGDCFPVLVLDYSFKGRLVQEGLHRAFAAALSGVGRVPVLVVESLAS